VDADWFKNLCANPNVHMRVQKSDFDGIAEPVVDPIRIADFIELRLSRHPIMMRLIMWLVDGLPLRFSRDELENFSKGKAMAVIHPFYHQTINSIGV
jgi:hypothetical protein